MDDVVLTKLLCQVLGTIPGWAWLDHAGAGVGVFYGAIGSEPDRAVGVRLYDIADADDVRGRRAQFRFRGSPWDRASADALADEAERVLTSLVRFQGISGVVRESFARLGADESGRDERADNYTITLDNEEASAP